MEWFLLIVIVMLTATVITYSSEMYLYLSLVIGSIIKDIKNKINSIISRKK